MPPPSPNAKLDGVSTVTKGMHAGVAPRLLPTDQVAFAVNCTFRNGLPRTRPVFRKVALTYADLEHEEAGTTEARATQALFQCASYHQAYGGGENCLLASIGGRLFRYLVGTTSVVQDISVQSWNGASYDTDLNSSINPNCWMWQAEDWTIVQNGQKYPLFFDGSGTRRSLGPPGQELPPGCMGAYAQGRVWMALPNNQQPSQTFMAGDLVYSHGFTDGYGGRSAVLKTEENTFFSGGGAFSVPVNTGAITAMSAVAIADTSLGQGPLQVMTKQAVFSVSVPILRDEWATTQYPLMAVGLPNYGAVGARAVAVVNGDLWYRSLDGIRSYQVARRDFNTWVNTPLSVEVEKVLLRDTGDLLERASAVLFDNRLLVTCLPQTVTGRGTVHRALVALDFNNISNLTTRSLPAYDGVWTGINVLQVVKGVFNGRERCFAFALDCNNDIVLYEVLADGLGMFDWDGTSDVGVESSFDSRAMGWPDGGNVLKKLLCGDLYLDKLAGAGDGTIDFQFKFRGDEDPFWELWHEFSLCAPMRDCATTGCPAFADVREQYCTYLRLPDPPETCSRITRRMRRTAYEFQVKMWVRGYWQLNRLHLWAEMKSDSVVQGCPTSQNCALEACEPAQEPVPLPPLPSDEMEGIVTEGNQAWITTEGGDVIRTEDQRQVGVPGTPGTGGGGEGAGGVQPALPVWPAPTPYACAGDATAGELWVVDPTDATLTPRPVGVNAGGGDPGAYVVAQLGPQAGQECLNAWASAVWQEFLASGVACGQARLIWANVPIGGDNYAATQVFPAQTGPYNTIVDLPMRLVVEYCAP